MTRVCSVQFSNYRTNFTFTLRQGLALRSTQRRTDCDAASERVKQVSDFVEAGPR